MKALFLLLISFSMLTTHNPLAKYQWQNRLILVFAPSATDELYQAQIQAIELMGAGFAERDLVLFSIFPQSGICAKEEMQSSEIQYLNERFQIEEDDFVVILIGKDGGEKLRLTQKILTQAQLFPLIDGMPMRKAEMRARKR
ncbi:MAG: DUF4174 domain-containing protein [Bacteroidota bacterium]